MARKKISLERRYELAGTPVTLDGKRAVIAGVKNDFATVATIPQGPRYEWAWETVEHIVTERAGKFKTT